MPSSSRVHRPSVVLGATVFGAGVVGGLASELLPPLTRVLHLGVVATTYLNDTLSTMVVALAPLVLVYVVSLRAPMSLPIPVIAVVSLSSGVVGEWMGIVIGAVVTGTRLPSPVVLVTPADIALDQANVGLLLVLLFGILTAGLWSLVGTFGGIGLVSMVTSPD